MHFDTNTDLIAASDIKDSDDTRTQKGTSPRQQAIKTEDRLLGIFGDEKMKISGISVVISKIYQLLGPIFHEENAQLIVALRTSRPTKRNMIEL